MPTTPDGVGFRDRRLHDGVTLPEAAPPSGPWHHAGGSDPVRKPPTPIEAFFTQIFEYTMQGQPKEDLDAADYVPRRARTIDEFAERIARFVSPSGLLYARAFRPRPDDVVIATFPKSGTTWMQQIAHGLRTRGDMSFEEITEVTPWIEAAFDVGWDLEADQIAAPRIFKSHLSGEQLRLDCRSIVVLRDPIDALVSFYDFMNGWFLEPDVVSIESFVRYIATRDHHAGDYWSHLTSWWMRRREPGVLLTAFEELKRDLPAEVRRVAAFLGVGDDAQSLEIATRQSRFEFMKAHESQFDEHLTAHARNRACGLPEDARCTKVHRGESGQAQQRLDVETRSMLDEFWNNRVTPVTGFVSYAELLVTLRGEIAER